MLAVLPGCSPPSSLCHVCVCVRTTFIWTELPFTVRLGEAFINSGDEENNNNCNTVAITLPKVNMVHLKITHSKRISPYPPHFILHSFSSIPAIYLHSGFCCLAGCLNFSLPTANHLSNPHHRNSSSSPKMWAPAYRKPIREKPPFPLTYGGSSTSDRAYGRRVRTCTSPSTHFSSSGGRCFFRRSKTTWVFPRRKVYLRVLGRGFVFVEYVLYLLGVQLRTFQWFYCYSSGTYTHRTTWNSFK